MRKEDLYASGSLIPGSTWGVSTYCANTAKSAAPISSQSVGERLAQIEQPSSTLEIARVVAQMQIIMPA